jgi:hypothetical protein
MKTTLKLGSRWALGVGVGAVLVACGAVAGCQNRSGGTGTGGSAGTGGSTVGAGGGGLGPNGVFTPQSCGFQIAPRMEYTNWQASAPVLGTMPNIRRVRLGLGGNVEGTTGRADPSTEFGVAWQTDLPTDASKCSATCSATEACFGTSCAPFTLASEVQWGTTADPTSWPAANHTTGVSWLTPPGSINDNGPEIMHEAYVCGLTPGTTYYYRVGGGPTAGAQWSPVFSFTTTPAAGTSATVKLAITGDSRGEIGDAWQILQRKLHTLAPTMALFSGDVINLAPDQGEWEQWLDRAELDSDGKTYLTLSQLLSVQAHGNHDNHTALFYGNVVLPQDIGKYAAYAELFYSFDVGPVHVVFIDDYWVDDPSGGDPNYQPALTSWLNADLTAANANRSKVPWIITVQHHPPYSSSLHGNDSDVLQGRAFFAPIFQMYHVDMSFAGHDHDYERSHPLSIGSDVNTPTNTTDALGTTFVVCAGSGADAYSKGANSFTAASADFTTGALGIYAILTATGTTLSLAPHYLQSDGSDPAVEPPYTITK